MTGFPHFPSSIFPMSPKNVTDNIVVGRSSVFSRCLSLVRTTGFGFAAACLLSGCPAPKNEGQPVAREEVVEEVISSGEPIPFSIREAFGVSHPEQIIDFDVPEGGGGAGTLVELPGGQAVAYQWLEGGKKLALRTGLGANEKKLWEFRPGKKSAVDPQNPVEVREVARGIEISNGLVGVRLPVSGKGAAPAPIQAVKAGGAWTSDGFNPLNWDVKDAEWKVEFLERGPLVTRVRIRYDVPDGQFYRSTMEFQAGMPSVLIEEEGNARLSYEFDFGDVLIPTLSRYRGHISSEPSKGVYPGTDSNVMPKNAPFADFEVKMDYGRRTDYAPMTAWDRWILNSGMYWQMFDEAGGPESPLVGIFAGRASRQVKSNGSGVNAFTLPATASDSTSIAGPDGRLHFVSVEGGGLVWRGLAPDGKPEGPIVLGQGLEAPALTWDGNGQLVVMAYRSAEKRFEVARTDRPNALEWQPVKLADAGKTEIDDPVPYIASRGSDLLLFFYAKRNGGPAGVLYIQSGGTGDFVFIDRFPNTAYFRSANRPAMLTTVEGEPLLLTATGDRPKLQTLMGNTVKSLPDNGTLEANAPAFGVALNALHGWGAVGDALGNFTVYSPEGKVIEKSALSLSAPHHNKDLNRRSLAVNAPGDQAAAVFDWDAEGGRASVILAKSGATWSRWKAAEALGIHRAQVLWQEPSNRFVLLGWKSGQFVAFAAATAGGELQELPWPTSKDFNRAGFRVTLDGTNRDMARFEWGLFAGTQGKDLKPPTEVQPINVQHNVRGGINLNKLHRLVFDYPEPPQGHGALFMPAGATAKLREELRNNPKGPAQWILNAEPQFKEVMEMWQDNTGVKAAALAKKVQEETRERLDKYVNKAGVHDKTGAGYWHGSLAATRALPIIDQLLVPGTVDEATAKKLKEILVLNAAILFDNDFAPIDNWEGVNLGTPNMPLQFNGSRQSYALALAAHPMMKERIPQVVDTAKDIINASINESGAHEGSLHYIGASAGPLLALLQQMKTAGIYDAFQEDPKLRKFAEFYLQTLTPEDVRFTPLARPRALPVPGATPVPPETRPAPDMMRFLPAIGDGSTERTEFLGILGTAFADIDPELSQRLMGGWDAMGKSHSGFHSSTILRIDESLPSADPALRSTSIPGYFSVLRSEWGTPFENAIFVVNGNFYVDHAHNDMGAVVMYLLGAPVSTDWGSIYTPRASGGAMHSGVVQEKYFGQPWNEQISSLTMIGEGLSRHYGNHGIGEATALEEKPDGTRSVSTIRAGANTGDLTWTRTISLVNLDPESPVVFINDTFAGADASLPKIWTMNMMAAGPVQTPAGPMTPELRTHTRAERRNEPTRKNPDPELPSAGPVFPLAPGVSVLGFTGEKWKGHPSEGVDWNLYLINDEPKEALLGNWAVVSGNDADGFKKAQGRDFEERQHILRLRGNGSFTSVFVPWQKGKKPGQLDVRKDGADIVVQRNGKSVRFSPDGTWTR